MNVATLGKDSSFSAEQATWKWFNLLRFSKGILSQKAKYANVWKTNKQCQVKSPKPKDNEEQLKWAHERCVQVFNGTSVESIPFAPCLSKLSEARRKTLYQQCTDETCRYVRATIFDTHSWYIIAACSSCAVDAHDCPNVCSWFASLSESCRKEGQPIKKWRSDHLCRRNLFDCSSILTLRRAF